LKFGGQNKRVLDEVLNGKVDAGILQSGALDNLCRRNGIPRETFRVLPPWREYPGVASYPHPVSSRLYPRSSFVQLPHTPDSVAEKVALALLSFDPIKDPEGNRLGWTVPLSYESVRSCMAELRLGPF
jgi:hypothetical protein